jgi:hypothetical protein
MFTWANVALTLLKLVNAFIGYARDRKLISAGEDAALGRAAVETLRLTTWGKEIAGKIDALPKKDLDDLADQLGADDGGMPKPR